MSGPDTLVERLKTDAARLALSYRSDIKTIRVDVLEAAAELSTLRERCETAERDLGRVEAERDAAEFAARNGRSLSEDSIHAIRELLNEAGVPKAAFIDDHVGNAVVQRNQAIAARDEAVAALEWYADLPKEWTVNAQGLTYGTLHLLGEKARAVLARATQPAGKENAE